MAFAQRISSLLLNRLVYFCASSLPYLLKTNVADMERYTGVPVVAVVPPYQGPDIQKVQLGWVRSFIDSKELWNTVLGL